MAAASIAEGTVPFIVNGETFSTYYKIVGTLDNRTKRPLVIVHGGPALSHDYLLPLGDLATHGRPVILYDQIGSGRSAPTPKPPQSCWTFDLFIDELANLVRHLQIDGAFDVLGHSWGGMILSEFVLRRGHPGLKRAVLSNPIGSIEAFGAARMHQAAALPPWVQEELQKGFLCDTPEFRKAAKVFSQAHQCRVDPQPKEWLTSVEYSFKNVHVVDGMYVLLLASNRNLTPHQSRE
jgi:proline-specific peptidase